MATAGELDSIIFLNWVRELLDPGLIASIQLIRSSCVERGRREGGRRGVRGRKERGGVGGRRGGVGRKREGGGEEWEGGRRGGERGGKWVVRNFKVVSM